MCYPNRQWRDPLLEQRGGLGTIGWKPPGDYLVMRSMALERSSKAVWTSVDKSFFSGGNGVLFCNLAATEFLVSWWQRRSEVRSSSGKKRLSSSAVFRISDNWITNVVVSQSDIYGLQAVFSWRGFCTVSTVCPFCCITLENGVVLLCQILVLSLLR